MRLHRYASFVSATFTVLRIHTHFGRASLSGNTRRIGTRAMQAPASPKTDLPFVSADEAAKIDEYLMGPEIGYTLDQLMELAGQAVALGCHLMYPTGNIAVCCGPGNNGGDGLVAARWLRNLSREVCVVLPSPSRDKFPHLEKQCRVHDVPILHSSSVPEASNIVVDALFGFSFRPRGEFGVDGELRELIESINTKATRGNVIVSVDCPSGWHVDKGDIYKTSVTSPSCVISLTAPKLCMKKAHENQEIAHIIGGRFIATQVWNKFNLKAVEYPDEDLVVRVA